MNRAAAGEVSLGYEAFGPTSCGGAGEAGSAAPPLVLLPGLGMRLEHWAPHLPFLAARRRVIALDLRGGVGSDAPPGPYTIRQLAADVAVALGALDLERVDLLGLSMGGFVAQELALAHPARVRRLLLALTARRPSARGRERLRVSLALRERPELLEAYFRDLFLWILDDATYARPGAVERLVRAAVAAAAEEPLEGVRGQVAACLDYEGCPGLAALTTPTLVLGATDDLVYPPGDTRALADAIPGARHALVEGAHLLSGAAVRRFDEVAVAFLDGR
ncbi:MAG TPA: alpha/beta fold hydrolase [Polyangiaceae bacterium]|nr:alpha/beta fold hydrolase [Polyangiaceae bacterium]